MTAPTPRLTVEAQPFIPYVPDEEVVKKLGPTVEPYMKRMGFLPNALKLYAYRPEIAATLWALNSKIMRDPSSALDQFLKRKLAVVCCAVNGCAYCTAHSCTMLKAPRGVGSEGWGVSEEELQDLITGDAEPANEFERACFDYVRAASADPTSVPTELLERLKQHRWPGNVRELENLARRLAALYPQDVITASVIDGELAPPAVTSGGNAPMGVENLGGAVEAYLSSHFSGFPNGVPPPGLYHRILKEIEVPLLTAALAATRGNQIRAADLLGLNRNTLRKKIRDLDIQVYRSGG